MKCALHPNIKTDLRCGKCDQPICPKCVVQTPVGARCPKCAALKRLPVFEVSPAFYTRAIAAGLLTAAALGAIWPFIPLNGFFLFFIALGVGYAIGEIISFSVNKKRSRGLQVIAGVSVAVSYVVRTIIEAQHADFSRTFLNMYGLIAVAIGIIVAVSLLRRD